MTTYGSPASPSRGSASSSSRERMMSLIGGALGVLMFIFGFLKWLNTGENGSNQKQKYAGFAFGMPTTAVIGLSLAAGLLALLGATEHRPGRGVPSAIPTALAGTSLLLAFGILLGKGSISPSGGGQVGVEVGLILGLITALVQTGVFAAGLASRHDDAANTGAPVPQYQQDQYQQDQYQQPGPAVGQHQPGYQPGGPAYGQPQQPGAYSTGQPGNGYPAGS